MAPAFITSPALLIAAIAGTGALMGGVIVWARNRQQRRAEAARQAQPRARDDAPVLRNELDG